jgi:hypothetical protein
MSEYDKMIEEHTKFQSESRLRVNKLLAENDPLFEHHYQEKRVLLVNRLQTTNFEMDQLVVKLKHKNEERKKLLEQIRELDENHDNWEPV